MTHLLVTLLFLQSGYTKPAGWVDQAITDGVKISAPKALAKDPKHKDADDWFCDVGTVSYGFHVIKSTPKTNNSNAALTDFVDDFTTQFEGAVDGEKDLLLQGWKGIALTIKAAQHRTIAARGYFYKDRVVIAYADFETNAKRPPAIDQYLNSIQLSAFGTATTAGPDLARYTLGKTGVSGLFPAQPTPVDPAATKKMGLDFDYAIDYCGLFYNVQSAALDADDLAAIAADHDTFYGALLDGYATNQVPKAKSTAQHRMLFGVEPALYREYSTPDGHAMAAAAVQHDKKLYLISMAGPKPYITQASTDAFFPSIQFADTPAAAAIIGQVQPETPKGWIEQTLSEGIKVSAPVTIKRLDFTQAIHPSGPSHVEMWRGLTDDSTYQFSTFFPKSDYKGSDSDMLSQFVEGMFKSTPGHIEGARNILVQGWRGIAVTYVTDTGITACTHALLLPRKIIAVASSYAAAPKRPDSVDRYLDSIKIPTDGPEKSAGPPMTRFPIGDTGISIVTPSEPVLNDKISNGKNVNPNGHSYSAKYCLRTFGLTYSNIPAGAPELSPSQVGGMYGSVLDEITNGLGAKQTKQRDIGFGAEVGLYREFASAENGLFGSVAVILHHRQMVILLEVAPKGYPDPASVEAFYKSLEFKN